jgi:Ulp1 family protease
VWEVVFLYGLPDVHSPDPRMDKVLAKSKEGFDMTRRALCCLSPGEYVNDTVMDSSMELLQVGTSVYL